MDGRKTTKLSGYFKVLGGGHEVLWEALHLLAFSCVLMACRAVCVTFCSPYFPILRYILLKEKKPLVVFPPKIVKRGQACYGSNSCQISFLRNELCCNVY